MVSPTTSASRTHHIAQSIYRIAFAAFAILQVTQPCLAQEGDIREVHDPTVIRSGDDYFMFTTGLGNRPGIPIRRSRDLFHWVAVGEVFPTFPQWAIDRKPGHNNLWAPHVVRMNGRFHLYYAVSTFGTNNSTIGLATNVTLDPNSSDYEWRDEGIIVETRSGRDDWNAIDPNIATDTDGTPWLITGSYFSGIKAFRLNPRTGRLADSLSRGQTIARRPNLGPIEAPYVVRHGEFFYLFVSFDYCCKGTKSDYKVMVGRSRNIAGPYVDFAGRDMRQGGGTLVIAGHDDVFGPGHNSVLKDGDRCWFVHHFYDGEHDGIATLQIRPLHWHSDGWPLVGEPISEAPKDGVSDKPIDLAGGWDHSVNYQSPKLLELLENHRIGRADAAATWTSKDHELSMRWPRTDAPGGAWIDRCIVADDGQSYVGRNQNGMVLRGVRRSDSEAAAGEVAEANWRFFDIFNRGVTERDAVVASRDGALQCRNNVRGYCLASAREYEQLELTLEFRVPQNGNGSASVYVGSTLPTPTASDWKQQIPRGLEFKLGPGKPGELFLPRPEFAVALPLGQLRDRRRVVALRKPPLLRSGWNTLRVTCDKFRNVTFKVNGETINAVAKAESIKGHIIIAPATLPLSVRNVRVETDRGSTNLPFVVPK